MKLLSLYIRYLSSVERKMVLHRFPEWKHRLLKSIILSLNNYFDSLWELLSVLFATMKQL